MISISVTRRPRAPRPVLVAIGAAWALALGAHLTGVREAVHHDSLIEGGPALWSALGLFMVAWQAHVAAMMLPSSLPMFALFDLVAGSQPRFGLVRGAFVGGYGAVWTVFGALALAGDAALHRLVERSSWLDDRSWLIGGGVLMLAGLFQFSGLKDRCLRECRHPGAFLLRHYRRGVGEAFRLGARHGLFCVGCCWALMVVMFAAGLANLAWMAPLAVLMFYEKTGADGRRAAVPIGVGLLVLGALVMMHPGWLLVGFSGS